jgi:ribosomal-protein-alanine N-acetyltransferase
MTIETDRLILVSLTPGQLELWMENLPALESELGCFYDSDPMEGSFLGIVKKQLALIKDDEPNYLFYSFWFIIRREGRVVVGSADFKGRPNKDGELEIGYGLGKKYEHHGYMTETVRAMSQWALGQKTVTSVVAETEKDNIASQNVLMHCGFKQYKQARTFWWKLC